MKKFFPPKGKEKPEKSLYGPPMASNKRIILAGAKSFFFFKAAPKALRLSSHFARHRKSRSIPAFEPLAFVSLAFCGAPLGAI